MKKKIFKDPRFLIGIFFLLFIFICSLFATWLAPFTADDADITIRLCKLSKDHWLGCDAQGLDVLSAVLYGGQLSLKISFITVLLSLTIGIPLGMAAGYYGGFVDLIISRVIDFLMSFPGILISLSLAAFLGPRVENIIFALTITGWIGPARLARGQAMSMKAWPFVESAKSLGAHDARILFIHILPQMVPQFLIWISFSLSGVIIIESSLSFLGLGPIDGFPTWGGLLGQGKNYITEAPHLTLAPGIVIFLTIMSLNFVGDALRDYLDKKA